MSPLLPCGQVMLTAEGAPFGRERKAMAKAVLGQLHRTPMGNLGAGVRHRLGSARRFLLATAVGGGFG